MTNILAIGLIFVPVKQNQHNTEQNPMKATVTITSASLMALMLTGCVTITSDAGIPRLANGVRPQHPIYRTYAYKGVSSSLPVGQASFVEQADNEVVVEQTDPVVEQTSAVTVVQADETETTPSSDASPSVAEQETPQVPSGELAIPAPSPSGWRQVLFNGLVMILGKCVDSGNCW